MRSRLHRQEGGCWGGLGGEMTPAASSTWTATWYKRSRHRRQEREREREGRERGRGEREGGEREREGRAHHHPPIPPYTPQAFEGLRNAGRRPDLTLPVATPPPATNLQAFEGLRNAGRRVRRPDCTLVTVDHNVPTTDRSAFKNVETFIKEVRGGEL